MILQTEEVLTREGCQPITLRSYRSVIKITNPDPEKIKAIQNMLDNLKKSWDRYRNMVVFSQDGETKRP